MAKYSKCDGFKVASCEIAEVYTVAKVFGQIMPVSTDKRLYFTHGCNAGLIKYTTLFPL